MVDRVKIAKVYLWGEFVGAVQWNTDREAASFEYDPGFAKRGLDISPLQMPLSRAKEIFSFNNLNRDTYWGLPGLLADSLPDHFGNQLIDTWLLRQGRVPRDFTPVERLCYTGKRGMGALEYVPAAAWRNSKSVPVDIAELVGLVEIALGKQSKMHGDFKAKKTDALKNILRVGTSAGGMRAKAVIALNPATGEIRSGQLHAPPGFEHWIIKLDGVKGQGLGDPIGYGRIEYAYYKMAQSVGINMSRCELLEEGGRAHFMTRRFDRTDDGVKLHMQSLCALAHYDYRASGAYGYEQAFEVMRKLHLIYSEMEQLYRSMIFNVLARNHDNHTKNISFLMDQHGNWSLAPAFDVTYSYNPDGQWANAHQMSLNGKTDNFLIADLIETGMRVGINSPHEIIQQVQDGVVNWVRFAKDAGVSISNIKKISRVHRVLG
ncbi:type II toxin-antitoxin system HipA family toxin [Candidatus Neomarinimicrobiota bacterium]